MPRKYLVKGCIAVAVLVFIAWGKMIYMQREHFIQAERYYAAADWKLSIREYDAAMHFYTPWSPYITKSERRLWQIGEMFESQGKPEWANDAYASIRSSMYASRSLYTPHKDWIEECDEKIAGLNVKMLIKDGSLKPEDAGAEKAKQLYVLKVDRAPKPLWAVSVEAGFFGWIASAVFIALKGFDEQGKMRGRVALYGILSFIFTFALWALSLFKA